MIKTGQCNKKIKDILNFCCQNDLKIRTRKYEGKMAEEYVANRFINNHNSKLRMNSYAGKLVI